VAGGHVHRAEDAFRKYLGHGKRAHVAAGWPAIEEAVAAIRASGGDACIAHPARYTLSSGARRQLISDFAAAGGSAAADELRELSGEGARRGLQAPRGDTGTAAVCGLWYASEIWQAAASTK